MLGGFFVLAVLYARDAMRFRWAFAASAFCLPWVRLEYVAIALFASAALGWLSAQKSGERWTWRINSLADAVPLIGAGAGVLVYFLYNGVIFGGIVPVSAAVKTYWSRDYAEDWVAMLARFANLAGSDALLALELGVYLGIVLLVPIIRRRVFAGAAMEGRGLVAVLVFTLALCLETVAMHLLSSLFLAPHVVAGTDWYYVPAYLSSALAVPVRCYVAICLLRTFLGQNPARRLAVGCVVVLGMYIAFDKSTIAEPFRQAKTRAESTDIRHSLMVSSYLGAAAINRTLPRNVVVGSWNAGVLGYFADVPVVNLDGLANSYVYLAANRAEDAARMFGVFGITHFVDSYVEGVPLMFVGHRVFDGPRELAQRMWSRGNGSNSVALAWGDLPSLLPQADSAGNTFAFTSGRLVQVFVPNCEVARLPDGYVVSWQAAGDGAVAGRQVMRLWPRPQVTALGYCTTAFLLPHGVVGPIDIEPTTVERRLAGTRPVIEAHFDVYVEGDRLIYVRDGCSEADTAGVFYLHVFPAHWRDLSSTRASYGNHNLDFRFNQRGRRVGSDRCLAAAELPKYEISHLSTGQILEDGVSVAWQATSNTARLRQAVALGRNRSPSPWTD